MRDQPVSTAGPAMVRDPEFAAVLQTIDATVRRTLTTLLRRAGRTPGRRLPLPAASAARWIQGLVDAGHLGIVDRPRTQTVRELRQIVAWISGLEA